MKILGIETSCDETAASVVENGRKILSNIVASSASMHAKTGGVIPEVAARQQLKSIIPVIRQALSESGQDKTTIDTIAVTIGPGLIGSLLVGVETAKTLGAVWNKPIVPVNHLVGHIYANWIEQKSEFPALALVVSGGHTDLVLMKDHGNIKWIGGTRDDAAGEAFDKTARLLGLPYPGGPNLSKLAQEYLETNNAPLTFFPRPLSKEENFDWSFSGLKTAVSRAVTNNSNVSKEQMAAETQEAIVDSLTIKSVKAAKKFKPKSFLLAGGVAANTRLREKLASELSSEAKEIAFHVPEAKLCTDNAVYIAAAAFFNYHPTRWQKLSTNPQLTITE